jgi:hypothetical protein
MRRKGGPTQVSRSTQAPREVATEGVSWEESLRGESPLKESPLKESLLKGDLLRSFPRRPFHFRGVHFRRFRLGRFALPPPQDFSARGLLPP